MILGRSLLAVFSLLLIPLGALLSPLAIVVALSFSLVALNKLDGIDIPEETPIKLGTDL